MKENKSKFRERLLQLIKTVTVSVSCVALVGCLTGASTSAKRGMSNAALFGAISASSLGNSTASAQQTARANQQTSYDLDGITSAQTEYYEPEPLGAFGVNKYHPDSLANPYGVKGGPKVQHRADEKCGMWLRFSVFTALGQFISFDGHLSIPMALL